MCGTKNNVLKDSSQNANFITSVNYMLEKPYLKISGFILALAFFFVPLLSFAEYDYIDITDPFLRKIPPHKSGNYYIVSLKHL